MLGNEEQEERKKVQQKRRWTERMASGNINIFALCLFFFFIFARSLASRAVASAATTWTDDRLFFSESHVETNACENWKRIRRVHRGSCVCCAAYRKLNLKCCIQVASYCLLFCVFRTCVLAQRTMCLCVGFDFQLRQVYWLILILNALCTQQ